MNEWLFEIWMISKMNFRYSVYCINLIGKTTMSCVIERSDCGQETNHSIRYWSTWIHRGFTHDIYSRLYGRRIISSDAFFQFNTWNPECSISMLLESLAHLNFFLIEASEMYLSLECMGKKQAIDDEAAHVRWYSIVFSQNWMI